MKLLRRRDKLFLPTSLITMFVLCIEKYIFSCSVKEHSSHFGVGLNLDLGSYLTKIALYNFFPLFSTFDLIFYHFLNLHTMGLFIVSLSVQPFKNMCMVLTLYHLLTCKRAKGCLGILRPDSHFLLSTFVLSL